MSIRFAPNINAVKQFILSSIFIIATLYCTAQQNEIVVKLVKEGMALHDKGEYEAAIAKFDRALILAPNDYEANYEKSSSLLMAGKYDESIAISKFLLTSYKEHPSVKGAYVNIGSAYDDKGDADSANIYYDEGIKRFPDFYLLYFNKGLTYARQKKWEAAEASFVNTMKLKPNHAGSLYYASLLQEKSNKVAAIISGLTFLAIEPEGKRAKNIYEYVFDLLNSFVKKNNNGGSTITLSMDDIDNKQKENNFSMVEMGLAMSVAASFSDTIKIKNDVDNLVLSLQILSETLAAGQKDGKGIYWETYAPFFIEMGKKEFLPVFAHIAAITSGNEENVKWIGDNQDKLQAFYQWMEKYEWQK